ncbi:MAG: hypothetical protein V3V05_00895 [Pontiella sp.]
MKSIAKDPARDTSPTMDRKDNGLNRLAILLTGMWIALAFIFLSPLSGNVIPFLSAGVLPVALLWGIRWVVLGFNPK